MADLVTFQDIRAELSQSPATWGDPARLVKAVAAYAARDRFGHESQELTLRLMERRDAIAAFVPAIDSLARQFGLFPYVAEPDRLSLRESLAYELHRSDLTAGDRHVIFHREQAGVFHALLRGENVILSAPTSFGKSLIIDAVVASGQYSNVVLVLPTLALVDETRRRLRRFSATHKVITHGSQSLAERNIFVVTQERLLERLPELPIDLFVIDEFYKLSPELEGDDDDGRTLLLNHAFYLLRKSGAQFYMLGPNIKAIPVGLKEKLEARFIVSNYSTVVSEIIDVPAGDSDEDRLLSLLPALDEPTIVYCRSPARANEVALLLADQTTAPSTQLADAAAWAADEFHSEWSFAKCLSMGIGVHHGQIPRALGQFVVRRFNDGELRFLVCTSTLIEGVNTCAKNVVLFDNAVGGRQLDFFTFNNIKGRSGRMFRHFIGRVFLLHPPPEAELPLIDLPVVTQPDTTSPSLLIHLDDADLSERSRERLEPYREQEILDQEVLKLNVGVDLDEQLRLAADIAASPDRFHEFLDWTTEPSYDQLRQVVELLRDYPLGGRRSRLSAAATATLIRKFRRTLPLHQIIQEQVPYSNNDADAAVTSVLGFIRNYLTFSFPKGLRALDRIQNDVFKRLGKAPGNLAVYASRAERAFLPGGVYSLDEFGIPLPLAMKLAPRFPDDESLDATLDVLRALDPNRLGLSAFERQLVREAQEGL